MNIENKKNGKNLSAGIAYIVLQVLLMTLQIAFVKSVVVLLEALRSARTTSIGGMEITNADKIRSMTDEELATLFTKVMAGNSGVQLDGIWQEKGMEENQRYFTRLNWLDWLKQEAN